ncbi:MAG: transcription antitermination factor NusB [Clostridiales bacterium]|nr:transcription antitermination factor NusB [Clostridiales bacterium]
MKRSEMREQAFFLAFENLFDSGDDLDDLIALYSDNVCEVSSYAKEVFYGLAEKTEELDNIINTYSKRWNTHRLPKVSLAILYVSVYEIMYVDDVPDSVCINEAVELAKKYGEKSDASYINGVLGSVVRGKK